VAAIHDALPTAEIGFAVKERFADLVAGNPAVTRVHALKDSSPRSVLRLSRELRTERYSAVVDLHANFRSAVLSRLAGARTVTRYRKRDLADSVRVRFARAPFRARARLVDRYLAALAPLGIGHGRRRPRFHVAAADAAAAERFLAAGGLSPNGYAAVTPGSKWPTKMWPAERFGDVVRALAVDDGLPVLVLGSADERAIAEEVVGRAGAGVNAAGRVGLGVTAGLLARARIAVGNDSGPTHIAMAAGTPTVAIFGPTDPSQFDFEGHELVYADLPCSACSFFGSRRCRLGHWRCMASIESEAVVAAARRLLRRGGAAA
jgi:ADP-heptose:LPS heptosyltransferase